MFHPAESASTSVCALCTARFVDWFKGYRTTAQLQAAAGRQLQALAGMGVARKNKRKRCFRLYEEARPNACGWKHMIAVIIIMYSIGRC